MKPIFTCFSVCQGVQELLLLGRKENSQGMKFSTQSSRPAMVRFFTPLPCRCVRVLSPWIFLFIDWGGFSWNLDTDFKDIVYFEHPFLGFSGCLWWHGTSPTPWVTYFKGATIKKAKEVMLKFRFFFFIYSLAFLQIPCSHSAIFTYSGLLTLRYFWIWNFVSNGTLHFQCYYWAFCGIRQGSSIELEYLDSLEPINTCTPPEILLYFMDLVISHQDMH